MPKIVDHHVYREELLVKCLPIFVKLGVAGVSIRDLATEMHVSTGTLYHYFPTKENLFEEMVRYYVRKDSEAIAKISDAGLTADNISPLLDYIIKNESHFQSMILLALDVKRFHSHSQELTELLEESWKSYRSELRRFFQSGGEEVASEALLSFFVGALFLKLSNHISMSWDKLFIGLGEVSEHFLKTKIG